jgi:DNA-binding response OmpR family regulator
MPRILLVDDEVHLRGALTVSLRAKGFDVVGADDAASGLIAFQESRFDLAVVDVYMPGVDGVRLIKALRERSPRLPIVAISGVRLSESQRTALDFLPRLPGLSEIVCLQKPFRLPELVNAIQAALIGAA